VWPIEPPLQESTGKGGVFGTVGKDGKAVASVKVGVGFSIMWAQCGVGTGPIWGIFPNFGFLKGGSLPPDVAGSAGVPLRDGGQKLRRYAPMTRVPGGGTSQTQLAEQARRWQRQPTSNPDSVAEADKPSRRSYLDNRTLAKAALVSDCAGIGGCTPDVSFWKRSCPDRGWWELLNAPRL